MQHKNQKYFLCIPVFVTKISISLIQIAGLCLIAFIHLTTLIDEVSKPVIAFPIRSNRIKNTLRSVDLIVYRNHLSCTLNKPRKHCTTCVIHKMLRIVFDVLRTLNFCVKRNDNQSSPSTVVRGSNLWKMIGIEYKCMRRFKVEWCFELLFSKYGAVEQSCLTTLVFSRILSCNSAAIIILLPFSSAISGLTLRLQLTVRASAEMFPL